MPKEDYGVGSSEKGHSWHGDLHHFHVARVRSLIIMCNFE